MYESSGVPVSVIFDSDVLIWASRRDAAAEVMIESAPKRTASIISLMELLQGARSKAEFKMIHELFAALRIQIIPVDPQISQTAAVLIEDHALSGGLQIEDALIAATARETGQTLATGNVRHFRSIPRLHLKHFRPRRTSR